MVLDGRHGEGMSHAEIAAATAKCKSTKAAVQTIPRRAAARDRYLSLLHPVPSLLVFIRVPQNGRMCIPNPAHNACYSETEK